MTKDETAQALPLEAESRLSKEVLGTRLKQLRDFHCQTQCAFADKIGVRRQTLASWEQGVCVPSIPHILKLRDLYKISMEDFLNPSIPVEAVCTRARKTTELERRKMEWEEQKRNEQERLLKVRETLINEQEHLIKEQETQMKNFVMFAHILIAAVLLFSTTYPLVGLPLCIAYFMLKKRLGIQNRILDVIGILCLVFNCCGTYIILNTLFFHFGYGEVEKIASCFNSSLLYGAFFSILS